MQHYRLLSVLTTATLAACGPNPQYAPPAPAPAPVIIQAPAPAPAADSGLATGLMLGTLLGRSNQGGGTTVVNKVVNVTHVHQAASAPAVVPPPAPPVVAPVVAAAATPASAPASAAQPVAPKAPTYAFKGYKVTPPPVAPSAPLTAQIMNAPARGNPLQPLKPAIPTPVVIPLPAPKVAEKKTDAPRVLTLPAPTVKPAHPSK